MFVGLLTSFCHCCCADCLTSFVSKCRAALPARRRRLVAHLRLVQARSSNTGHRTDRANDKRTVTTHCGNGSTVLGLWSLAGSAALAFCVGEDGPMTPSHTACCLALVLAVSMSTGVHGFLLQGGSVLLRPAVKSKSYLPSLRTPSSSPRPSFWLPSSHVPSTPFCGPALSSTSLLWSSSCPSPLLRSFSSTSRQRPSSLAYSPSAPRPSSSSSSSSSFLLSPSVLSRSGAAVEILTMSLLLSFALALHELGHLAACRAFRIPVREIEVGVGPRIFSWTLPPSTSPTSTSLASSSSAAEAEATAAASAERDKAGRRGVAEPPPPTTPTPTPTIVTLRAFPFGGCVDFSASGIDVSSSSADGSLHVSSRRAEERTSRRQLPSPSQSSSSLFLVHLAGPLSNFLTSLTCNLALLYVCGTSPPFSRLVPFPTLRMCCATAPLGPSSSPSSSSFSMSSLSSSRLVPRLLFLLSSLSSNLCYLNLLPIASLDGGNMLLHFFSHFTRRGRRRRDYGNDDDDNNDPKPLGQKAIRRIQLLGTLAGTFVLAQTATSICKEWGKGGLL